MEPREGTSRPETALIPPLTKKQTECSYIERWHKKAIQRNKQTYHNFKSLNPELNPICYLLALLAHHFLHVTRIRVVVLYLLGSAFGQFPRAQKKKNGGVQFCTSPKIGPTRVSCPFLNFEPIFEFESIFEFWVYFLCSDIIVIGDRFRIWVTVEVSSTVLLFHMWRNCRLRLCPPIPHDVGHRSDWWWGHRTYWYG